MQKVREFIRNLANEVTEEPVFPKIIVITFTREGMVVARSMAIEVPWTREYWREVRPWVYENAVQLESAAAPGNIGPIDGVHSTEKGTDRWVGHGPCYLSEPVMARDRLFLAPGSCEISLVDSPAQRWLGHPT